MEMIVPTNRIVQIALLALALSYPSFTYGQDLIVRLVDTAAVAGQTINIEMQIDNSSVDPIQGFSFSFRNATADLTPESVAAGVELLALNGGAGPDFLNVLILPGAGPDGTGITCGTVFSFLGEDELDPGLGLHCLDMDWTLREDAVPGETTLVDFCDCLGSPPAASVLVINGASIVPSFETATVQIIDSPAYIRGDPNGSGALDLADPIYTLDRLFQAGPVICRDAMDANADGAIDLADVLYLLDAINGFGPLPTAPFPDCGAIPGPLGCDESGACQG